MNKFVLYISAAIIFCSILFISCQKDIPNYVEFEAYEWAGTDPNGGTWKTILDIDPSTISIPTPQSTGSPEYRASLEDLVAKSSNLTASQKQSIEYWTNNPTIRWNEIARSLAAKYNLAPAPNEQGQYPGPDPANPSQYPLFPFAHPPYACRAFAYLSASQFDALVVTWHHKGVHTQAEHADVDARINLAFPKNGYSPYPSDGAAVTATSLAILKAMFPLEHAFLDAKAAEMYQVLEWSGQNTQSDISAGKLIGQEIAQRYIQRASTDGMRQAQTNRIVSDSIKNEAFKRFGWHWENLELPQRPVGIVPKYGKVRTWFVPDVTQIRPGPPPAPGSAEFAEAVRELESVQKNLTNEQRKIANWWSDGLSSYTPPGHWNRLACDYIIGDRLNPLRTARVLAYMNTAIMDAGIACWDVKYYYHYPRPSQAVVGFKTILGIPNFPSFTSGHSTFSSAAAETLAYLFPQKGTEARAWAREAAESRIYAGIHFRFDSEVGIDQGKKVSEFVIARAQTDGAQ